MRFYIEYWVREGMLHNQSINYLLKEAGQTWKHAQQLSPKKNCNMKYCPYLSYLKK